MKQHTYTHLRIHRSIHSPRRTRASTLGNKLQSLILYFWCGTHPSEPIKSLRNQDSCFVRCTVSPMSLTVKAYVLPCRSKKDDFEEIRRFTITKTDVKDFKKLFQKVFEVFPALDKDKTSLHWKGRNSTRIHIHTSTYKHTHTHTHTHIYIYIYTLVGQNFHKIKNMK